MKKRCLSFVLVVCILFGLFPATVFAESELPGGTCGDGLTWAIDANGTLTISGSGPMEDYDYNSGPWCEYKDSITSIVVEKGITRIGVYAFYTCSKATSVSIADTVTSIGDNAFYHCTNLPSITIPNSVTTIGKYVFGFCHNLMRVNIPASVKSIGSHAFFGCSVLAEITLPNSITSISTGMFSNCIALPSVTIPDSVTTIGEFAFNGCEVLTEVTIPDSVTTIEQYAFQDCHALKEIVIPASVTSMGDRVFNSCPELETVTFTGNAPTFGEVAFENVTVTCYYPAGDATWTDDVKQNYGGTVTWQAVCNEHAWEEATCAAPKTCSACGQTDGEVNPDNHSMGDWETTKEATCAEAGEKKASCSRCDYAETEEIPVTEHTYEAVVTDPTCIEDGFTTHTCSVCGDSKTDTPVEALGHDMGEWETTKEATCTEAGEKKATCSRCDYAETEEIPVTEHSYESVVTDPTCTEAGFTTHTCSICGDSKVDTPVEALDHDLGEWETTKEATCAEAGEKKASCSRCDYAETEEIPVTEHSYEAVVTDPTCTEEGFTTHTCSVCDDSKTDTPVDALGHDLGEWETTKEATCAEAGEKKATCSRCDYTETEEIPVTEHSYEAVVTDPTCTEEGFTTHTCSVCGDNKTDTPVDALGHDMGEWVQTTAPTATTEGEERRECSRCDHYETRPVAATEEHQYVAEVIAPTCTEDGYTKYTCSECGDSYTDTPVEKLGHDLGEWETTKEATCAEAGEKKATCSRCDHTETEEIPVTEHSYEAVVTDPTCTEEGFTTHTCSVCGDSKTDTPVEALGHDMGEWVQTTAPTATTEGEERRECSRCDHYETRPVAATEEHQYVAEVIAPTCTEDGYTKYTCSECGDSYTDTPVEKLGHDLGEWETTKEATCTEAGEKKATCSRCDHTETEEIPVIEHSYESVVTDPTCTEEGFTTHTCSVCGDSKTDTPVDALGHDLGEWETTKEATCTEAGEKKATCSRCDHTETEEIPVTEHSYEAVVTDPTCTEAGFTTHTCSVCGDSKTDTPVEALGHDLGEWVQTTAPTATTEGEERRECSRCDHYETRPVAATEEHQYVAEVIAPTCTEDGYTKYTCSECGDSYTDTPVEALGHGLGGWVTTKEATCTETGIKKKACSRCDYSETESIAALGHKNKSVVTAPTCTADGYTTHTCSVCGNSYKDTTVTKLGHDFGKWTKTKDATPVAEGEEIRKCSRCDHSETRKTSYQGNAVVLKDENLLKQDTVWINGLPYPVKGEGKDRYVEVPKSDSFLMVTYTYHIGDSKDVHTQYPTSMKIYRVTKGTDGYKTEHISALDNLLQYSGCSIRITGKKGIRMITSLTKSNKSALTGKGLAGYKLVEYGTALCWASEIKEGDALVLGRSFTRSNYAYRRGVADPVFATTGNLVQYTNVLVGFSNDQCKDDIAMRPYIILEDAAGKQVTLYGGTIYRSIGYIAYQNRNVFKSGTESYKYVWSIIHHVYGKAYDADYKG